MNTPTTYDQQAIDFCRAHNVRTTIRESRNPKSPAWHAEDGAPARHGIHYRVTVTTPHGRTSFDFWGSIADMDNGRAPSAYDVLACVAHDIHTPDTFADFCADYGLDTDSIRALALYRRCARFARALRRVFPTPEMQAALADIQ